MKNLLLITMMIAGFCITGNEVRPRIEVATVIFWVNTMDNQQQLFSAETQPLPKIKKQHCLYQKPKLDTNNKRFNKQQNPYIHQPRSNNYAAKNRR